MRIIYVPPTDQLQLIYTNVSTGIWTVPYVDKESYDAIVNKANLSDKYLTALTAIKSLNNNQASETVGSQSRAQLIAMQATI